MRKTTVTSMWIRTGLLVLALLAVVWSMSSLRAPESSSGLELLVGPGGPSPAISSGRAAKIITHPPKIEEPPAK